METAKNTQQIECLQLSARACNILHFHGISTDGQLADLTERQLRKLHNCGRQTVNELREYLQNRGLDLAPSDNWEVSSLKAQVKELRATLAAADRRISSLSAELDRIAGLPLANSLIDRLQIQVGRFEQLMSKVFRQERRDSLMKEIEKLDNGQSPP